MSKMFFTMLAVFAEFEAGLLKMRTREAWPPPAPAAGSRARSPSSPSPALKDRTYFAARRSCRSSEAGQSKEVERRHLAELDGLDGQLF
jgi:hypothetical protein